MNTKLLRKVQKQILAEPRQFQMGQVFTDWINWIENYDGPPPDTIPNCGTAACIAGWTVALAKHVTPRQAGQECGVMDKAQKLLGITNDQEDRLFNLHGWPEKFQRGFARLTHARRARRAALRIDHFIATKGRE